MLKQMSGGILVSVLNSQERHNSCHREERIHSVCSLVIVSLQLLKNCPSNNHISEPIIAQYIERPKYFLFSGDLQNDTPGRQSGSRRVRHSGGQVKQFEVMDDSICSINKGMQRNQQDTGTVYRTNQIKKGGGLKGIHLLQRHFHRLKRQSVISVYGTLCRPTTSFVDIEMYWTDSIFARV